MPTFQEAMKRAAARAHNPEEDRETARRLREILGILRAHRVNEGLTPEKAVAVLQDLGPTFVKIGQIASTHPDMLPGEYCDAFAQLRAHVTPMPIETVRAQVERELGRPIEEVFSSFDERALGSASIAQVHKAQLRAEKAIVAVKVQRPGIVETVTNDLALMQRSVGLLEMLSSDDERLSLKDLVDELERTSRDELDFTIEAGNLTRFFKNNEHRARVTSPRCYPAYSTRAVLTMDYAAGPRIGDAEELGKLTVEQRRSLGNLIADNYLAQVLEDGFFHADPHAGNILIASVKKPAEEGVPDAAHDKGVVPDVASAEGASAAAESARPAPAPVISIEWIDFGMMGELSGKDRDSLLAVAKAIGKRDAYGFKRALLQIAKPTGPVDHAAVLALCDDVIQRYADSDLASFDTARLINDLVEGMRATGFDFPPAVTLLARGLVTLEGTIRMVSDQVNIMDVVQRYAASSFSLDAVRKRVRDLAGASVDSVEALASLPAKANDTLDMLQKGQVKVEAHLALDKTFRAELSSSIDHFSLAVMAVGLFMGSCVLCLTGLEPQVLGVPLLGIVGFATGLAFALYDLMDMRREKRRRK